MRFIEPPFADAQTYYRDEYRKTHDYIPGMNLTPEARYKLMYPLMDTRQRFFEEHVPEGGSVLEVGCSSGFFLGRLQAKYDVYGAEWNPEDAAYVRDVGEIPCEEGDLESIYPGKKFSAICAYAVLEHITDPIAWLKQAKRRLIGGGHLIVEVPNAEESLLTLYDIPEFRNQWYREPHICNFNLSNLTMVLSMAGFEARVHTRQQYNILNHMHWLWEHAPMDDLNAARQFVHPVPESTGCSWKRRRLRTHSWPWVAR
jgi:SAM-dependent methyltransferase